MTGGDALTMIRALATAALDHDTPDLRKTELEIIRDLSEIGLQQKEAPCTPQ